MYVSSMVTYAILVFRMDEEDIIFFFLISTRWTTLNTYNIVM